MINIENVSKNYNLGSKVVTALEDLTINFSKCNFTIVLGASGSGKTTLLNLIGALDTVSTGKIELNGIEVTNLNRRQQFTFRRKHIGFIFQTFNLFPTLSALENVQYVADLSGKKNSKKLAKQSLEKVGLESRTHHFPHQLSGGEQQRVAIARALVKEAPIILADEPTGELDFRTGKQVLKVLLEQLEIGTTIILVTHNREISKIAERVIELHSGKLVYDGPPKKGSVDINNLEW